AIDVENGDRAGTAVGDIGKTLHRLEGDVERARADQHVLDGFARSCIDDREIVATLRGNEDAVGFAVIGDADRALGTRNWNDLFDFTLGGVDDCDFGGRQRYNEELAALGIVFEAQRREFLAALARLDLDLACSFNALGVEDHDGRVADGRDIDLATSDDEVTRMGRCAFFELLYQRQVILLVDRDGVLAGVADPDIAVLVVDGNAVDRVDAAITIATAQCFTRGNLCDDFQRFRVHLEQRRLLD